MSDVSPDPVGKGLPNHPPSVEGITPTALFAKHADGMETEKAPSSAFNERASSTKKVGLVKDQLELTEVRQRDGSVRNEILGIDEDLSFDKGFFLTIRAIQLLKKQSGGKPILVGIAGPSGAGKTVFCQKIQDFMPGLCVLSMDMYNDATLLLDGNFDDPRLTDYDLLMENLQDLKQGKTVETPVYSFKESKRVGTKTVPCPESNVILVEGIYALSDKLRPLQDLRVSVSGGVHLDLVKRVMRDIDRSGQDPEDIIHQISETVYPMYKAFIEPDLRSAHLRVVNSFNPFAGFADPTYILKSSEVVTGEAIRKVLDQDGIIETSECETTDIYLLPPHEDPETCTSWLRMRNKDGRYTLMFEETMCDGDVMICPRIKFEVGVRILGGLMGLGYEVGAIMKRRSKEWSDELLTIKIDWIEGLDRSFTQIQGKVRAAVVEAGSKLGLDETYIPYSYIEQVQYEEITEELRHMTNEMKDKFLNAASRASLPPHPAELRRPSSPFGGYGGPNGGHKMMQAGSGAKGKGRRTQREESVSRLQDAVSGRGRGGSGGGGRGSSRTDSREGEWSARTDWTGGGNGESLSGSPPGPPRSPRASAMFGQGKPPPSPGGHSQHNGARAESESVDASASEDTRFLGVDGAPTEHSPFGMGYQGGGVTNYPGGSGRSSPNPFADGAFVGGLEVGGVNRLEGRLNNLAQRVEDLAANAARRNENGNGDTGSAALMAELARLQRRAETHDRQVLLAAGVCVAGCAAVAFAWGRGGR